MIRGEVLLRVVPKLQQAAAAAEPVGLAVVLERQLAGRGVDLIPQTGSISVAIGVLLPGYSHGV